jgi:hypothetical protein
VGPKEQGVTHWFLERSPPAEVKPEAPTPVPAPEALKR